MPLDDLELLYVRILSEFSGISQIWEPTTAKRIKIDTYRQRQNCSSLNVFSAVYRLRWYRRAFLRYRWRQTRVG